MIWLAFLIMAAVLVVGFFIGFFVGLLLNLHIKSDKIEKAILSFDLKVNDLKNIPKEIKETVKIKENNGN